MSTRHVAIHGHRLAYLTSRFPTLPGMLARARWRLARRAEQPR